MLAPQKSKKIFWILSIMLCLLPTYFFAQNYKPDDARDIEFWTSPKVNGKQVKVIKEWRRYKKEKKASLASAYHFRGDGLLGRLELDTPTKTALWEIHYQEGDRFHSIDHYENGDSTLYYYAFLDNRDVVEERTADKIWKTIYYKDDANALIEKKEFYTDEEEVGLDYRLVRRTVYHNNPDGYKFGEMQYEHPKSGTTSNKKTLYHYINIHSASKISKKEYYSQGGYLAEVDLYFYNDKGLLIKKERRSKVDGKDHTMMSKDLAYDENGLLSKRIYRIYDASDKVILRETGIYKSGRLIYRRVDDVSGFLFESNFQYITN